MTDVVYAPAASFLAAALLPLTISSKSTMSQKSGSTAPATRRTYFLLSEFEKNCLTFWTAGRTASMIVILKF